MQPVRGFSLIEVLVSLFLISTMLLALQAGLLGTPLARSAEHQGLALTIAKHDLEGLRATGYAALPASGSFSDSLMSSLPSGTGTRTVTAYNASTKQVTVTISWSERGQAQSVSLTTLITQTGGL